MRKDTKGNRQRPVVKFSGTPQRGALSRETLTSADLSASYQFPPFEVWAPPHKHFFGGSGAFTAVLQAKGEGNAILHGYSRGDVTPKGEGNG